MGEFPPTTTDAAPRKRIIAVNHEKGKISSSRTDSVEKSVFHPGRGLALKSRFSPQLT
jgi:hypothetical protein